MKYRLRKDLPFAKAGSEVNATIIPKGTIYNVDGHWIGNHTMDMTDWIEEVKPREWEISLYGGQPIEHANPFDFRLRREVVKVREIID